MTLGFSDIRLASVPRYDGVRIFESEHLVETVEDWSRVRSRGRAARRRKLGHRQNIRTYERPMLGGVMVGGDLYMHPVSRAKLYGQVRERLEREMDRTMLRLLSS